MKVIFSWDAGFVGCAGEEKYEFEDDTDDKELDQCANDVLQNNVQAECWWRKVKEKEG